MKKLLLLFILTASLSSIAQVNTKKLDTLFQVLSENDKWMGSIAMSINGTPIYKNAIGFADADTKKNVTTESKYRIGSISKTFTATLILQAVEEKKLNLEDKLAIYFPTIKNADKISISNLLNHRSGIYNFTNSAAYLTYYTTKKSMQELVELISGYASDFEPDSKFSYSNSNYVLLSFILEKVHKKSFKTILSEKIIKPLGLKNTYLGEKTVLESNEVFSFKKNTNSWVREQETDMSIPTGAGAIVSTPTDLTIFITSLFSGKLISQKSLSQMTTLRDKYGFGIMPFNFEQKQGFGHGGAIDAFTSLLYYFPEDKLSVALICNGNAYENQKILTAALNAYYNKPVSIPNFNKVNLTAEQLDQYLGEYSAPNFPLKITITKKENILFAQATGQSAFGLEATMKDTFEFAAAGIVLEFNPTEKKMVLKQGAGKYILTKP